MLGAIRGEGGADATPSLRALVSNEGDRRIEKPWWHYQKEIDEIAEVEAKDAAYRKALDALPDSAPLLGNFANFLRAIRGRHDEAEALYERAIAADPKHAHSLNNFASFLTTIRGRHDEAEALFQRAIDVDPKYAAILDNFASFLTDISERHDEAEALYQRAIAADPKDASILGNYAEFLLVTGRRDEGLAIMTALETLASNELALTVVSAFSRYAHDPEHRAESLAKLKRLIAENARSPGWNLSRNIAQAERDGHPNGALLKALDAVITRGEDVSTLEKFPEWRSA